MSLYALLEQLRGFYLKENWFLLGLGAVVLVAAVFVTLESVAALKRAKVERKETEAKEAN